MPAYSYEAIDERGRTMKGVIAADSLRDARQSLQQKALYPIKVGLDATSSNRRNRFAGLARSHKKMNLRDRTMVTRQLATMVGAGTPVEEALQALAANSDKQLVRDVLTRLRSGVSEGKRLSRVMAEEPSFDRLYTAMIAAGEASGDMGGVMDKIADFGEKSNQVRQKVTAALVYPAVLTIVALGVLTLLMVFVVPRVVAQFDESGTDLPGLTVAVMSLSDFLVSYGAFLMIALVCLTASFIAALKNISFRRHVHGFLLGLPLIGRLIVSVNAARFARTFGTLVEGGSPVLEAIRAGRETIGNQIILDHSDTVYKEVREGRALSSALKRSGRFPSLLVYMAAVGERSGSLAQMMLRVADYQEQEFDGFTQALLALLEPGIVILLGVMVGLIVMSIMLPILQLNSMVLG